MSLCLLEGLEGAFRISKGAGDPRDPCIGEVDVEMFSFRGKVRKVEDGTIVLDAAYNVGIIEENSRSRISAQLRGKRIIEKLVLGKEYSVIVTGNDSDDKGRRVRFDFTVGSKPK